MFVCFLSTACSAPLITVFVLLDTSESLTLNENKLGGPLPSEIGMLSNFVYLDVQKNRLTGEIPGEFGELTRLGKL